MALPIRSAEPAHSQWNFLPIRHIDLSASILIPALRHPNLFKFAKLTIFTQSPQLRCHSNWPTSEKITKMLNRDDIENKLSYLDLGEDPLNFGPMEAKIVGDMSS